MFPKLLDYRHRLFELRVELLELLFQCLHTFYEQLALLKASRGHLHIAMS